jgi:NADPH-dependent ferric siderophore reductase
MARVFLLHWHRTEGEERAAALRAAGHTVALHWSTATSPALKDALPDIAVISLDRLPSHGRAVAEWLWEAKKRQHIPIIFAGGEREKVAAIRAEFPRAVYCSPSAVAATVARLAAAQPSRS